MPVGHGDVPSSGASPEASARQRAPDDRAGGLLGLTSADVAARRAAGAVNRPGRPAGTAWADIVRRNVLNRFNAILGALFAVAVVVGPWQDALFGVVLVANTAGGLVQEVRAKRTIDRLRVLQAPSARVVRDGVGQDVPGDALVVDDLVELASGDQVLADGIVLASNGLQVDESLVTGESEPVAKPPGAELLSGTLVVDGSGVLRVRAVGDDAFGQRLQREARRYRRVRSELQSGTDRLLRAITWVMVPLGILLATSQALRTGLGPADAVRGSVAGVAAMVPEGLVLLTTAAFTLGAVRLARRRVLVQELGAVEGLARVDVLCIDKTGTLTERALRFVDVVALDEAPATAALGALARADPSGGATLDALRVLPAPEGWQPVEHRPFSAARRWSGAAFAGRGTWVLGAPEVVIDPSDAQTRRQAADLAATGRRVLALCRTDLPLGGGDTPPDARCSALVVLDERLRPDAPETVQFLQQQGVEVRVLSGDHVATVASVAERTGVDGWDRAADATGMPSASPALAAWVEGAPVLGRVRPDQKRAIVAALQEAGHVVAMVGDGLNDIPALKQSDLGIAIGSGSAATRAVGRVVLLGGSFAAVPQIVEEGRRVIANVERVARLFVTKTVYAAVLAAAAGAAALPYPFYPRHLTLVSSLTIGIPAVALALAPGAPRASSGFLGRVLRFAGPNGAVCAAAGLSAYLVDRYAWSATLPVARSVAAATLLGAGLAVLAVVARPLVVWRAALVAAMAGLSVAAFVVPLGREVFGLVLLRGPDLWTAAAAVTAAVVAVVALSAAPAARRSLRRPVRRLP